MNMDAKKNLKFHIEVSDYFATLATVLNVVREKIATNKIQPDDSLLLQRKVDELMYLQEGYKIVSK